MKYIYVQDEFLEGAVPRVSGYVFCSCDNLKNVFVDGITHIGGMWFEQCTSLTGFVIPDTVTTIETSAFADCVSLESIVLPENVSYVEDCAFQNCCSLTDCWVYNDKITFEDTSMELVWNGCDKTKLVLHGHKGSNIEAYAEKFGIRFSVIEYRKKIDCSRQMLVDS